MSKLFDRLGKVSRELLVRHDGPLTRDLLLEPANFGLGRLPKGLQADQTATMVCGFCSTGCGLEILLRDGQAVGLAPATEYPVNLGMACPKGWEALTPLRGPGRATTPLLRKKGKLVPASWEEAVVEMVDRFKAIQEKHGPAAVALARHGPDDDRGARVPRLTRQVRDGHGARRRQHAAVHGHGRRRLQAELRLRRSAVHLLRLRGVGRDRAGRFEPVHRAPHPVGARQPQQAQPRDRRDRSAPHRDGDGRDPPPTSSRPRAIWCCSTRSRSCSSSAG